MPDGKLANNNSWVNKIFRIIVKDTGFDPELDK